MSTPPKSPSDPAPAAPAAPAAPDTTAADNRFAAGTPSIEGIPEKFLRDGKVDQAALATSYTELEARLKTKTDDLKAELDASRLANRPEAADKYEMPQLEGADPEKFAASPLVGFWREQAFELGLDQEGFNKGIETYIAAANADIDAITAELGDNAPARLSAVNTWASKTFTDPAEFAAIQLLGTSAAGIKAVERLMGTDLSSEPADDLPGDPALTLDALKKMQGDPRYYDSQKRDPEFVKLVDEGYNKLYG